MINVPEVLSLSPDIRYVAALENGRLRSATKNAEDS